MFHQIIGKFKYNFKIQVVVLIFALKFPNILYILFGPSTCHQKKKSFQTKVELACKDSRHSFVHAQGNQTFKCGNAYNFDSNICPLLVDFSDFHHYVLIHNTASTAIFILFYSVHPPLGLVNLMVRILIFKIGLLLQYPCFVEVLQEKH